MYYDIILLGIVISILYAELTGYTPAGLVAAGYLAIHLKNPGHIALTLIMALITLGVCRLLGNVIILYGRRSFAAMVLISCGLNSLLGFTGLFAGNPGIIGYLITGIIARDFERQGIYPSMLSLGIVVGIIALLLMLTGHPVFQSIGGI